MITVILLLSLVALIAWHITCGYEHKVKKAEIEASRIRNERYEDWAFTWGVSASCVEEAFVKYKLQSEINFREWSEEEFKEWLDKRRQISKRRAQLTKINDQVGLAVESLFAGDPNKN